ncbi:restriction endonuclease [Candidatus Termititenax persephonae]|uniref:Restriction endonuclease n=1 Tax=Candidatus Termititenax persephonae TaxID=2218525 RepID=A0A388THY7_9BACT|nr:restriction endonuclease [Candidatus Termititenax persephonae]
MQLHFDSSQQYQLDAIQAIVDLFEGQPLNKGDFEITFQDGSLKFDNHGVGNNLVLTEEQILKNLQIAQYNNKLPISEKLDGLNFTVEMETGTGKTYVYLRTIYELNKVYGFKKFVIVVPSIAIKEGVLKNLQITHDHLQNLYANPPVNYYLYDSKKLSSLKMFASTNAIQILVINIDSFAKDDNVINQTRESGVKPIEYIQSVQPIVIVDEPQNMETDIRNQAIANLKPLCTLRYSATHKNMYNPVYKLDPVQAYDLGLVKQIEVDSVVSEQNYNSAYIDFVELKRTKNNISAKLKIFVNDASGVKQKTLTVNVGDNLFDLSNGREMYQDGFTINELSIDRITFANGLVLNKGQSQGGLNDEIAKFQIERTIEHHLQKEKKYIKLGLKVLSLFFIDKVANYREYAANGVAENGKYAKWFEELYKEAIKKPEFKNLDALPVEQIHNGYFAQDNGKFKDSNGNTKADNDTYNLIMKDKERLLAINEPLKFIFSHSALREGWDNPNVFQICTLNETKSELKKRQEIGRGLRLPVDNSGNRVLDKNINTLTVIANESYADFSATLQKEIQEDCNVNFSGRVKDAQKKKQVRLNKDLSKCQEFLEIWELIKSRTTYQVDYQTDELIARVLQDMQDLNKIPKTIKPSISSETFKLDYSKYGVEGNLQTKKQHNTREIVYTIPDIFGYIQSKIDITRSAIFEILTKSNRLSELEVNPQMFLDNVIQIISKSLNDLLVDGIKYEKIADQAYTMQLFHAEEIETYLDRLFKVTNPDKTLYNYIQYDSEIENKFAQDCEADESVKFYFKLPKGFKIPTPVGSYIPDWAVIFENERRIYFVAETKSSLNSDLLRSIENLKIQCGVKHFAKFKDIAYRKVTSVSELYGM